MFVIRGLSTKEMMELDKIAKGKKLSREALVRDIIRQFLEGTLSLEEHKKFFEEEAEKVVQVIERNTEIFSKVVERLEEKESGLWK